MVKSQYPDLFPGYSNLREERLRMVRFVDGSGYYDMDSGVEEVYADDQNDEVDEDYIAGSAGMLIVV